MKIDEIYETGKDAGCREYHGGAVQSKRERGFVMGGWPGLGGFDSGGRWGLGGGGIPGGRGRENFNGPTIKLHGTF